MREHAINNRDPGRPTHHLTNEHGIPEARTRTNEIEGATCVLEQDRLLRESAISKDFGTQSRICITRQQEGADERTRKINK